HPLVASLDGFAERVAGVHMRVYAGPGLAILGVALGAVVAAVAAWGPARRAVRADVAAEVSARGLRAEAAPRLSVRRAALYAAVGLVGLGAAWVGQRDGGLARWQPVAAQGGAGVAALALLLASGSIAPVVVRAARRVLHRSRAATSLGLASLEREPRRTSVMAVA